MVIKKHRTQENKVVSPPGRGVWKCPRYFLEKFQLATSQNLSRQVQNRPKARKEGLRLCVKAGSQTQEEEGGRPSFGGTQSPRNHFRAGTFKRSSLTGEGEATPKQAMALTGGDHSQIRRIATRGGFGRMLREGRRGDGWNGWVFGGRGCGDVAILFCWWLTIATFHQGAGDDNPNKFNLRRAVSTQLRIWEEFNTLTGDSCLK